MNETKHNTPSNSRFASAFVRFVSQNCHFQHYDNLVRTWGSLDHGETSCQGCANGAQLVGIKLPEYAMGVGLNVAQDLIRQFGRVWQRRPGQLPCLRLRVNMSSGVIQKYRCRPIKALTN